MNTSSDDDRKIELNSRLDGRLPNVQEDCLYNLKRLAEITLAYFNYQDIRENTDEVSKLIKIPKACSQKCTSNSGRQLFETCLANQFLVFKRKGAIYCTKISKIKFLFS